MTTSNTLRRIAGRPVQVERESDGVQRHEWLSIDSVAIGAASKARWNDYVIARRPGGETRSIPAHGGQTEQAFTAARRWLVEGAA